MAAVFPVKDLERATAHYDRLGFTVRRYTGSVPYAFAVRDKVEIHLAEAAHLRPKRNTSAIYLYVDDADALYAEWQSRDVAGRLVAPVDTDYGLREGAAIDADGNLVRFGSPMSSDIN